MSRISPIFRAHSSQITFHPSLSKLPIPVALVLLIFLFILSQNIFAAQIRIAWDPNTEPDLAGYRVYYGTASGTYEEPIDTGNVTTYTLTGLILGQTYFISVTALDTSNNESGYSNEVSGPATDVAPPTIATSSPLPTGTAGTAYSRTLTATGGTTPYSWLVVSGSLPPGLTLASATGIISGTPTTANTFTFRIRVTGANSLYSEKNFSLTINPAPTAPTIATSSPLPTGTAGSAYSRTLTATGGTTPYTWSVVSGSLPAGLTLASATGVVSGTPTTANTFTFRIRVTGANSLYSEKRFQPDDQPRSDSSDHCHEQSVTHRDSRLCLQPDPHGHGRHHSLYLVSRIGQLTRRVDPGQRDGNHQRHTDNGQHLYVPHSGYRCQQPVFREKFQPDDQCSK